MCKFYDYMQSGGNWTFGNSFHGRGEREAGGRKQKYGRNGFGGCW